MGIIVSSNVAYSAARHLHLGAVLEVHSPIQFQQLNTSVQCEQVKNDSRDPRHAGGHHLPVVFAGKSLVG